MTTGTVVKFDHIRGYGFVANESGGEDVFLHVNDIDFDKHLIAPGAIVEFQVEDSLRGPKAFGVSLVRAAEPSAAPVAHRSAQSSASGDDDGLCDCLSTQEFLAEVTEVLLTAAPSASAAQIVAIRQSLVKFAESHGWLGD
ncbi:cold-shock protein [Actinokineospora sp.]|uniref:cold-shock protein n=1 Tax=Actinokineospora sp. TaxID=1872133 RepID=UPI00403803DD